MKRSVKAPGSLFERVTGIHPKPCGGLLEIEKRVAESYGRPLDVQPYDAALIAEHGNVFSVSPCEAGLDAAIETELRGMTKATETR